MIRTYATGVASSADDTTTIGTASRRIPPPCAHLWFLIMSAEYQTYGVPPETTRDVLFVRASTSQAAKTLFLRTMRRVYRRARRQFPDWLSAHENPFRGLRVLNMVANVEWDDALAIEHTLDIIKPGDTMFASSEDVGPRCTCSRCALPIVRGVPIRAFDPSGDFEYRYHPACVGFDAAPDINDTEYDDVDDGDYIAEQIERRDDAPPSPYE